MKFTKETQINSYLKENGIKGSFLLWGSEDYLIGRWKDTLVKGFEDNGFNFTVFDGQNLDFNEVYDAAQQLPLMAPEKCVFINDIDPKKLVAEEQKKLIQLLEDLPEETVLVATCRTAEGGNLKKLVSIFDKYGVAVELSPRDTAGIAKYLQSSAKKQGCTLSGQMAKEIIRISGNQLQTLTTELAKICAYAGCGEITKQHIDAVITPTVEERVFNLGKAILGGNTSQAMEITANLIYLRENPVMIVSTLIMNYTDIYRAQIGKKTGAGPGEISDMFAYKGNAFRIRNAFNTKISTAAVRESMEILYDCDSKMKSTGVDNNLILEETVLKLIYVRDMQ